MEAGREIGLQTSVIAKVSQFEISQMHGHSIEDSGADSRTKKRPAARAGESVEAFDFGGGRFGHQQGIAVADRIADVMTAIIRLDNDQGREQFVFVAAGFGLGHVLKVFGLGRIFVPIDAIEIDVPDRILN
jgi:hypothetical protein